MRDIAALTYKEATREPVVTEAREIFAILDAWNCERDDEWWYVAHSTHQFSEP